MAKPPDATKKPRKRVLTPRIKPAAASVSETAITAPIPAHAASPIDDDEQAEIGRMLSLSELIKPQTRADPRDFLTYLYDLYAVYEAAPPEDALPGANGPWPAGPPDIAIGIAVSHRWLVAFGRRESADADFERIKSSDVAVFDDLDISTSSVISVRGVPAEETNPGARPFLAAEPGKFVKEQRIRWHDVRLCHPIDVPPILETIAWLDGKTPLDMIYDRYVLGDYFVQETKREAKASCEVFALADGTIDQTVAIDPPIISPPWRQMANNFMAAYWTEIQERAGVVRPVSAREMPEVVRRFMVAVRYPLYRLLVLLDRGDLIGHGIHPVSKERRPIERLFWRRKNIKIDFAHGDIFNAQTGELEWGYVTISAVSEAESDGEATLGPGSDYSETDAGGSPGDKKWRRAFYNLNTYTDVPKRLNWLKPAASGAALGNMLLEEYLKLSGGPDKNGKPDMKNATAWLKRHHPDLWEKAKTADE